MGIEDYAARTGRDTLLVNEYLPDIDWMHQGEAAQLNAYMHSNEEKYRDWILDYIEAWRERYASSNGIMPDNAGPSGVVGETMEGKWYGGHYGWTFPHGFYFIGDSMVIAGENERLLTGKEGRLDWVREQIEMLKSHAIEDGQGRLLLPQKYADTESVIEYKRRQLVALEDRVTDAPGFERAQQIDGWYEFTTMNPSYMSYVYMDTFHDKDKQLLFEIRDQTNNTWDQVSSSVQPIEKVTR